MNHEDTTHAPHCIRCSAGETRSFLRGNQGENGSIPSELEKVAALVVDSAFAVHKNLGMGLLESVYEICFCHELQKRGLKFERQVVLPIMYDGLLLDDALRLDVLVDNQIICELKAVDEISPLHQAQMLTYLKLANKRLGFLINFNVPLIKHGIKRMIL